MIPETHKERFRKLLQGYIQQSLADDELADFNELVKLPEYQEILGKVVDIQLHQKTFTGLSSPAQASMAYQELLKKLEIEDPATKTGRVFSMRFRRIAAAAIIILLGTGSYFLFFNKTKQQQITHIPQAEKDVEAPGATKAMITLSNGQSVALDSINSGTLAVQGSVNVIKTADGQIVYNGSSTEIVYNTLYNPRGSTVVSLTLNDGTKVWLNSESSMRYPAAFAGNERRVEITGEAYFEVAKDVSKKFVVTGNGVTTEVLGTHFNVNAYSDETSIKVTLLEGRVKVTKGNSYGILQPGQQAQVSSDVKVMNAVDVDEVIAWKNGEFQFGDKADIGTIMRQISRWYNVEVEYKGTVGGHIGGSISRNVNVSQVLKMLEKTGGVRFSMEGNKVTVLP